jgi:hypothetical protein
MEQTSSRERQILTRKRRPGDAIGQTKGIHPDPRRGGIISGLFFAAMFALLALFAVGIFVMRTVRVTTSDGVHGTDVFIDTPGGRVNIRARDHMSPAAAGVPVYPGAERVKESGGANIEWNSADGRSDKNLYIVGGEYRTNDSPERVVEFYRDQLHSLLVVSENNRSTRLEYNEGAIRRIISVREKDGETRIGVASIGGSESN